MLDKIVAVIGTLAVGAVLTAALLPGRQTPQETTALFNGFANAERGSEGLT